jgi:hypothetical protein
MHEIKLVRRGTNALKPEDGDSTRVAEGSAVTFTVEPGVVGTAITFAGDTPFDSHTVSYGTPLQVKARFNASDANKNKYRYRCHGTGPKDEKLDSDSGGGEMEIIRG